MSTGETETDEHKTCAECEYFDSMVCNLYRVCLKSSYVDEAWGLVLDWLLPDKPACDQFKEVQP